MKTLLFKVQSYVDVITNSSTEIFCIKQDYTQHFDSLLQNVIDEYNKFIEEHAFGNYSTLNTTDFYDKVIINNDNINDTYFADYDRIIDDELSFYDYFRKFSNEYIFRQKELNILNYENFENISEKEIYELETLYLYYKNKYNKFFKYYLNCVCYEYMSIEDKQKLFKDEKYDYKTICNFVSLMDYICVSYMYQKKSDLIGSLYITYDDCKNLHPYFCELAEKYLKGKFFSFH